MRFAGRVRRGERVADRAQRARLTSGVAYSGTPDLTASGKPTASPPKVTRIHGPRTTDHEVYSTRNAVSGSKRVARHDGIRQAAMVTVVSSAMIPTNVTGSVGGIWATTLASA